MNRRRFVQIAGLASSGLVLRASPLLLAQNPPVAGPTLWLRRDCGLFTDAGTTPAVAGDSVYQWNDQSGNGYHVTQSTAALRPQMAVDGSLWFPGYTYPGSGLDNRCFNLHASTPINSRAFTLFVVSRANSGGLGHSLWQSTSLVPGLLSFELTSGPGLGTLKSWGGSLLTSGLKNTSAQNVQVLVGRSASSELHLNEQSATVAAMNAATPTGGLLGMWNASRWWMGTISEVLLYPSALTASQISSVKSWLYARHAILSPTPTKQIVCDGDSLTFGYWATDANNYPNQLLKALGNWRLLNYGKVGQTLATMVANGAANIDSVYDAGMTKNICLGWGGTNDLASGTAPATVFADYKTYGNARKVAGLSFVAFTILPRVAGSGTFEADRQTFNTSVRGDASFYDALVDVASDSRIGDAGDNTDPTYYLSDHIHMNPTGYSIVAARAANAVNSL